MTRAFQSTADRLPPYLKAYVTEQDYDRYTARDHATWRYIMRQSRETFRTSAHPIYLEGLKRTGIPISRIPKISDMDKVLQEFGWGAVCVRGFIPPLAFLDFQARKILAVAADMRTLEHMPYTPAPDIVHEAAGHAPIIADQAYRNYLTQYAHMARKSIFSDEDIRLYEAIRVLSDVKENPDSTPAQIKQAEAALEEANRAISFASEATLVTRMAWWTVEYGLIGSLAQPQIYGAGLLSSLGEGGACLDRSKVEHIPLSLDCVKQSYDITEPQPQLFVARDFAHLVEVLEALEKTLAFHKGGLEGLEKAKQARTVTTVELETGLEISGVLTEVLPGGEGVCFLKWAGPTQLSFKGRELEGQGRERHPHGFSTPLGPWTCEGLKLGHTCTLHFESGFQVTGVLQRETRVEGRLLLLTFTQCRVSRGDLTTFEPEWGEFDMAVGHQVASVYGGPADWESYGDYDIGKASTTPGRMTPYTESEKKLFGLYQTVRDLREAVGRSPEQIEAELVRVSQVLVQEFPKEWLLGVEIAEVASQKLGDASLGVDWFLGVKEQVLKATAYTKHEPEFIAKGLGLRLVRD